VTLPAKYLILAVGMFSLMSCGTSGKFTESRVSKNQEATEEIRTYLLRNKIDEILTDSVEDKGIKKKLRRLRIEKSTVATAEFAISGHKEKDTIIQFDRWGFWVYHEQLLLVNPTQTVDEVLQNKGYVKFTPQIYYQHWPFPIM
jgi:hypothetical protein